MLSIARVKNESGFCANNSCTHELEKELWIITQGIGKEISCCSMGCAEIFANCFGLVISSEYFNTNDRLHELSCKKSEEARRSRA